ncbi:hypothetical protein [Cohnella sp. AR92]|uniref:hypothetical protein n=1 Tax=Cohnella sp. AR92 TaxID=648716 RepID=UPI000F8E516C|nr:hypothetical protein [Cohnella sp. AR92]RUS46251.1 hypothetical protein ELR57_14330 [Cohnella sp. AR92]
MSKRKTVWIPAILAAIAAALLLAYSLWHHPSNAGRHFPPGGAGRPPREEEGGLGGLAKTLGTISLYLGAAGFVWFWFKKKLKSPSLLVRRVGKLLRTAHKPLGWATLLLIAVHGAYFLFTKLQDHKIWSGLAAFAILLAIAGYGFFVNKIRNKWMRTVHRTLGLLWVPVLVIHAGGSAILASAAALAVGAVVALLEKKAAA